MGLHDKEEKKFSVKAYIENRPIASRGVGAVQLPDGISFYKFKEIGTVRLDIIPYITSKPNLHPYSVDNMWYERTYFVHRNIGQDNTTVICPKATFNKPCPICEYRNKLDSTDEGDLKIIKNLRPQERQLFNVVIVNKEMDIENPKIFILDVARFGFGKLLDDLVHNADEDDEHYQYFADLKHGSTLKLNIEEKNTDTFKFFGVSSIEIKARKYQYDESILKRTVDLDTVLQVTPYAILKDMYHGLNDYAAEAESPKAEDSNYEQIERLKKEADSSKNYKSSKVSEDEEDEPFEKPKKKSLQDEEEAVVHKKAKPPVVDEDDEPKPKKKINVSDEEDDEPKPKKKVSIPDDDDDAPPVKPKSKVPFDDEEDEPKPKKKVSVSDDEDEPKPKKKVVIVSDDEEDEPKPKKKVTVPDDEDDEPPAKSKTVSKKSALVEDWDDED